HQQPQQQQLQVHHQQHQQAQHQSRPHQQPQERYVTKRQQQLLDQQQLQPQLSTKQQKQVHKQSLEDELGAFMAQNQASLDQSVKSLAKKQHNIEKEKALMAGQVQGQGQTPAQKIPLVVAL
ncbi:MAG: hypothetical protein O7C59_06915, partial [Rickettsia endosymbiont of Ixodes persulcatus]|nr:hypothetical protein [Rickettsia endosymbiont of Ixodes persulcatus]